MKRLFVAAAAGLALMGSSAAMARVNVDISVGIPGVIYAQPDYYYPPVQYVAPPPRVIVVPPPVYRPAPVYRARYYRNDFRNPKHYKKHDKRWKKQHGHHHHHR